MDKLEATIKERRSANKFVEGELISHRDFEEIFSLTKYAPSAYNLQHTHYHIVTDRNLIEKIYELAFKQYKIKTASAVVFVLGDTKAYLQAGSIYEGMKTLGVMSNQEYNQAVEDTHQFYENRGSMFQRDDAIRNVSLSAMQFMLIAKEKGWDTCPMHSLEENILQELLGIPKTFVPVMMITMGKASPESFRPRGYRKPVNEFTHFHE